SAASLSAAQNFSPYKLIMRSPLIVVRSAQSGLEPNLYACDESREHYFAHQAIQRGAFLRFLRGAWCSLWLSQLSKAYGCQQFSLRVTSGTFTNQAFGFDRQFMCS